MSEDLYNCIWGIFLLKYHIRKRICEEKKFLNVSLKINELERQILNNVF